MHKVYNYIPSTGQPPQSCSKAIICVSHKDGKDTTLCTSYHPISLQFVDVAFRSLGHLISKFIWQNKRPRVRLKILMTDKEHGALEHL